MIKNRLLKTLLGIIAVSVAASNTHPQRFYKRPINFSCSISVYKALQDQGITIDHITKVWNATIGTLEFIYHQSPQDEPMIFPDDRIVQNYIETIMIELVKQSIDPRLGDGNITISKARTLAALKELIGGLVYYMIEHAYIDTKAELSSGPIVTALLDGLDAVLSSQTPSQSKTTVSKALEDCLYFTKCALEGDKIELEGTGPFPIEPLRWDEFDFKGMDRSPTANSSPCRTFPTIGSSSSGSLSGQEK